MCLRPCQEIVGRDEYRHETNRVAEFLKTGGHSLLDVIAAARDRNSQEMMFEDAARQHKRFEKVQEALKLQEGLSRELASLHGVAMTPSSAANAVELWIVRGGDWQVSQRLSFEVQEGKPVSLDGRLREIFSALPARSLSARARQEYLALLARWYYSSWRDGEWLTIDSFDNLPYRKLVHAISRVARRDLP